MKKILIGALLSLAFPTLAFAAANDVQITADTTTLSVNGIDISVYGTNATLQSIVVNSTDFVVTLGNGSSIEIRSSGAKVMGVTPTAYTTTDVCSSSESRLVLSNSGGANVDITVTPTSDTCSGSATTATAVVTGGGGSGSGGSGGGGGGGTITTTATTTTTTAATSTAATSTPKVTTPTPTTTTAPTAQSSAVSALVAQLKSLIAQLKALGGTVSPSLEATVNSLAGGSNAPSTQFTRDLKLGSKGDDVKSLQVWLNAHGYTVAASGPGSSGSETVMFGGATRAALIKFQKAKGVTPAAGYFGPKTRAALGM